MPGPEECFESKQALNARFRESNRNISPIEKDYHTNLKECKNDILFIAYHSIHLHFSDMRIKNAGVLLKHLHFNFIFKKCLIPKLNPFQYLKSIFKKTHKSGSGHSKRLILFPD